MLKRVIYILYVYYISSFSISAKSILNDGYLPGCLLSVLSKDTSLVHRKKKKEKKSSSYKAINSNYILLTYYKI